MSTCWKCEPDSENEIIGVTLVNDLASQQCANIGICVVPKRNMNVITVAALRELIEKQVIARPPEFTICTKQGWLVAEHQESEIAITQILTDDFQVLIKVKLREPKVGIKDNHKLVLGFVYITYNSHLATLRGCVQSILPEMRNVLFQFLDGNLWPVATNQEDKMTVADILVDHCVSTNINLPSLFPQLSPPDTRPFKKLKVTRALSFCSGKDVGRPLNVRFTDNISSAKQLLISYVRSEAANHALKLKEQLLCLGLSVYLDVHEIHTGVDWQDSLNFAVSGCKVFVPLVTQKYGETQWTNREVKLADVLGKYILPVSFLPEWPPRCLAIQFATTQFIPWMEPSCKLEPTQNSSLRSLDDWSISDIQLVAQKIAKRIQELGTSTVPGLIKRATVVRSCAMVQEDNMMATMADREGTPLIMICIHPLQKQFGSELQLLLEAEKFEVWCTTELDTSHIEHIDELTNSQAGMSYSVISNAQKEHLQSCVGSNDLRNIKKFQEKADDASVVLLVLSEAFSGSRCCQQQVFYCEHRKHVIGVLYEDFQMPEWMAMLVGSHGFQMKKDEDFSNILIRRIRDFVNLSRRNNGATSTSSPSNKRQLHETTCFYGHTENDNSSELSLVTQSAQRRVVRQISAPFSRQSNLQLSQTSVEEDWQGSGDSAEFRNVPRLLSRETFILKQS